MHDSEHVEPLWPVPIDEGRVAQSIVEYTGKRMGAVTYRGPSSGREYRFDASPSGKRKYVLDEDLELFRLLQDFQVLEEGRIDPEAEERERRERDLAELRAQLEENRSREGRVVTEVAKLLDDYEKQKERRPARRRGGRRGGEGLGAKLDCWMTCGHLKQCFGTSQAAYDAIYRYLQNHPLPGEYVPPRERFPSIRSDAKRRREKLGLQCL